ncbi:recombinase RecB [Hoyosella rhizosphaerae]|uniref:Recombinase RecB n=2 Tax=Hoyosella rhizosphaerae TaxID=1755582 RepID=A0A916XCS2_9ACTN|nr:recombinase RecB [Hoyosella rhizosphaerae]
MFSFHHAHWATIDADQPTSHRALDTANALNEGIGWVWGGMLPTDAHGRRGGAEILMRDLEQGGYIPIIVVNHKVTDQGRGITTSPLHEFAPDTDDTRKLRSQPRDQFRLAHLYRMLESGGWASPRRIGGVIGYDADCILIHDLDREVPSYDNSLLGEYDARFEDRVALVNGGAPSTPNRIGECKMCEFWPHCEKVLEEKHDVSLVVNGGHATLLREAGVNTVDELAAWHGDDPEEWHGVPFAEVQVFAKAWLHDIPLIRRVDSLHVQRADVEVDIDMESYQDHGAYLWGTLLTEPGKEPVYRPFVTWDPLPTRDEGRMFAEFWGWLTEVRRMALQRGLSFAAYCYSKSAENRWLIDSAKRFRGMNEMPALEEINHFIESDEWVDMFDAVKDQFLCPHGRGLKKIAPAAGFSWRDPEAGGEASMSWYRDAVGYEGDPVHDQRERILRYNEDDVWATRVLREWMSSPQALEVPDVAQLDQIFRGENGPA